MILNIIYPIFIYITVVIFIGNIAFNSYVEKAKVIKLSFITFVGYFSFALLSYSSYVEYNAFFQYVDQDYFYEVSQQLGSLPSVKSIYNECFVDRVHFENEGVYFYLGVISFFANNYLGGNTVFFQILNISLVTSLIPIFLFRILLNYVSLNNAFHYSIKFAFCSYIFYYSPWILRDMYIVLFYTIALSILYSSFKMYKLIILIGLILVTLQFRTEHGLFMIFIPLLYVYEKTKGNKFAHYSLIFIIIGSLFVVSSIVLEYITAIQKTLEMYSEFTKDSAEEVGGFGTYILKLPSGIKEIVIILYSQMSPFPSWNLVMDAKSLSQFIIGIIQMIAPFFWFVVWFCVINAFCIKSYRKKLSFLLIFSGLVFLLFLLVNTSNMNPRRLICMYPILYVFYVKAKTEFPFEMKKRCKQASLTYLALCVFYLFLKL